MLKCIPFVLVLLLLSLSGCGPKQPVTPEEIAAERDRQLRMITRIYENKTPQEILLAADRIFRLADEDYTVSHTPTGVQAQRNWMIYMVLSFAAGTDTWSVTTEPVENGTKVTIVHSGNAASTMALPMVTSGGHMSGTVATTPGMGSMTTRPAIYQLFFARLEHLLGNGRAWPTCKDAKTLFTDGHLNPFCSVANDRTPDGVSAARRSRAAEAEMDPPL